ncbi:carboxypeptidase-like regulatory domain-containing protein [Zunongwangia pacifica]|uniref:Carboxypeptidase-like regulatory domain-containing protein n=1 Tax=Zunongwangia pacifica TaxID=2911062 RepID=A0A9X2CLE6_9FLAO|nr:carboxypeptidase-like regulatory domain-containing protein [Zunongwangia pacifica]MCL6218445.1 carboxypeptidase-like regulatory domain-containing protein [Zunongwangia pacifica]
MRYLLFLVVVLLKMSLGFSQEREALLGKITNDSIGDTFINIVNLTAETGTVNEPDGRFAILVRENDSILFSSVQFQKEYIVITRNILEKGFLEVTLTEEINQLETVHLSNIKLMGDLASDIKHMKVKPLMFIPPPRKKLTMAERRMGSYGGGLGMLIGMLNGEIKYLEKAQENYELQDEARQLLETIPKSIFTEDFGLEEWEIINFMFYCARKNDPELQRLVAKDDILKLIDYFKAEAEAFKTISREENVSELESKNR